MEKNIFTNSSGSTLFLFVIFLPIILILSGLIIDVGRLFVAKSEMQGMIDAAANAGISIVGDEIIEIIQKKKEENPELEIPDAIETILTNDDRQKLLNLEEVTETAREYLERNNISSYILDSIQITYPYNYHPGDGRVYIKISWQYAFPLFFSSLLGKEQSVVSVETISSIPIR